MQGAVETTEIVFEKPFRMHPFQLGRPDRPGQTLWRGGASMHARGRAVLAAA